MNEKIFELMFADEKYIAPINRLLQQLSSSPILFTVAQLDAIVSSPSSSLYLLQCGDDVLGMVTLCSYLAPTGRKYWIEDVVVDSSARGRSYGRRLVEHAIACAREKGSGTLLLTSKPARVAANALYRSAGFEPKETNVYKMKV